MAGMLPGVEAARRRRFHQSNNNYCSEVSPTTSGYVGCSSSSSSSTKRSSFFLYASSRDFHPTSHSFMRKPVRQHHELRDESTLGAAVREAKNRLDERLQPRWRLDAKRTMSNQPKSRYLEERPTIIRADLQMQMPLLKKSGSKRLNWLKLNWKSSEQEECAVCLERFKATRGETLMQLPCAHRFHTNCLVPWLERNAHCPCCRKDIPF